MDTVLFHCKSNDRFIITIGYGILHKEHTYIYIYAYMKYRLDCTIHQLVAIACLLPSPGDRLLLADAEPAASEYGDDNKTNIGNKIDVSNTAAYK